MANIVDGQIEWLKDESTGVPVGFKKKDGTDGGLVTAETNPLTGGLELYAGGTLVELGGGTTNPRSIKNLKATNSAKFLAKLTAAIAGGAPATIARIGDSTAAGAGAGTSANGSTTGCSGAWPNAPMQLLTASLNAAGSVSVSNNSFFSSGTVDTTSYTSYDSRVNIGAWTWDVIATLGGPILKSVAANATLTFQLSGTVNRVKVFHTLAPGLGQVDVLVNGANVGTITENAANAFVETEFSFAEAVSPIISLVAKTSTMVYVAGVEAWKAGTNTAIVRQFAHFGKKVADVATAGNPWAPLNSLDRYQSDLTIVSITINDANFPTAKAAYMASLELIIQKALVYGDVWLALGIVSNTANSTNGNLYEIQSGVNQLAETYDLPVISLPSETKSYAMANAAGLMFDGVHPTLAGYVIENNLITSAFAQII